MKINNKPVLFQYETALQPNGKLDVNNIDLLWVGHCPNHTTRCYLKKIATFIVPDRFQSIFNSLPCNMDKWHSVGDSTFKLFDNRFVRSESFMRGDFSVAEYLKIDEVLWEDNGRRAVPDEFIKACTEPHCSACVPIKWVNIEKTCQKCGRYIPGFTVKLNQYATVRVDNLCRDCYKKFLEQ